MLRQLFTKPPVLFPLAALFHLVITLSAVVSLCPTPFTQIDWLRPLGMLLFTLLSFGLCLMRKMIAIAYVVLSLAGVGLLYTTLPDTALHLLGMAFFPFNLILSFFILLFFKRFGK